MTKKIQRTLTMTAEIWDYIDQTRALTNRSYSQEIEYIIMKLRSHREQANFQAIKLTEDSQPQTKPQSPE